MSESITRAMLHAAVTQMLREKGVCDLYKDQIEEVAFASAKWLTIPGNTPESLVYAICNNTLPFQALLSEGKVAKILSTDGSAINYNDDKEE